MSDYRFLKTIGAGVAVSYMMTAENPEKIKAIKCLVDTEWDLFHAYQMFDIIESMLKGDD